MGAFHACTYSLEVVSHFKLILLVSHVALDLRVCVVDDGQEHVDQHEEDEENEQHEEDRTKVSVSSLQLVEVKVSQNDTEQGKAGNMKVVLKSMSPKMIWNRVKLETYM
jgi:hypothetical protein